MLAHTLPARWHARFFQRPLQCLDQLRDELPRYKADAWYQQSIVNRWHKNEPLITQLLHYWSTSAPRHELSGVLVIDYAMPGKDGLQVLRELQGWPGARILLTGQADAHLGVQAFNEGLIDQFIEKQSPGLAQLLTRAVQQLHDAAIARLAGIWQSTLTQAQHAALGEPATRARLLRLARWAGWVEYVSIGDPFGILALGGDGQVYWTQLEFSDHLQASARQAALRGVAPDVAQALREGRALSDLHLQDALGQARTPRCAKAFSLGAQQRLRAAVFPLNGAGLPDMGGGYNAFLARQPHRHVRG